MMFPFGRLRTFVSQISAHTEILLAKTFKRFAEFASTEEIDEEVCRVRESVQSFSHHPKQRVPYLLQETGP